MDLRALAVLRVCAGVVLMAYLASRLSGGCFIAFHTDLGVLPVGAAVYLSPGYQGFSLLNALRTPQQVGIAFVLMALALVSFTVGYRTRWSGVLVLLGLVSLHTRNVLTTNASMAMMHVLVIWMLLLPISARFSVDAWLRARKREDVVAPGRDVALAYLAFRWHLAAIYALTCVHKSGETWMDGTAVHYVLWQDRYTTAFGSWFRSIEPTWFSPFATYGTLFVEALLPVLLVVPVARKWCRRATALLMILFHWGIATLMDLGPFPQVLSLFALLVLCGDDWAPLFARLSRRMPWLSADTATDLVPRERPLHLRIARWSRELVAISFAILFAWEIRDDNKIFNDRFGPSSIPRAFEAVAELLHLPQGWMMYTPDALRLDHTIVVDAERIDGTHVDPLTGKAPDFNAFEHGPWHQHYLWQTYQLHLAQKNERPLWIALIRYLERLPEIEQWDGDHRFREIDVWIVKRARVPRGAPEAPVQRVSAAVRERRHDDVPYPKKPAR